MIPEPIPEIPFHKHGSRDRPQVALTFDDGPVPGVTDVLLDELKKRKIKATFFLIGRLVEASPDLARRVLAEGHDVGNHTFTHPALADLGETEANGEIQKTEDIFAKLLGHKAMWFRPPYASLRPDQAHLAVTRGMNIALWDVDSGDWRVPADEGAIVQAVLDQTQPGSVILCHDLPGTARCIGEITDRLLERGLSFVSLSILLDGKSTS